MITHDLGVVAGLCDCVNVMYSGRIVESADRAGRCSPQPRHPLHRRAAGLASRGWTRPRGEPLRPIPGSPTRHAAVVAGLRVRAALPNADDDCAHDDPALELDGPRAPRALRCYQPADGRQTPARRRRRVSAIERASVAATDCCTVAGLKVHFPIRSGLVFDRTVGARQGGRRRRPRRSRAGRPSAWSASPAAASPRSGRAILRLVGADRRARSIFDGIDVGHAQAARSCGGCGGGCRWSSRTRWPASTRGRASRRSSPSRCVRARRPRSRLRPARRRVRELLEVVGLPRVGAQPSTRTSSPAASGSGSASPGRSRSNPELVIADEPVSRAGRLDPGAGDQPARGAAGRARPDLPGDRPRPRRGPAHQRRDRR